MELQFLKYQAAGNDFVLIEDFRDKLPPLPPQLVQQLCHRRFGIGADGVLLLKHDAELAFNLHYYNADGLPGSLCGNGSRAAVRYAADIQRVVGQAQFRAAGGVYQAFVDTGSNITLRLPFPTQEPAQLSAGDWLLDTGSPHRVRFLDTEEELLHLPVEQYGHELRVDPELGEGGANVNFVYQTGPDACLVRTYERGVEAETYSCGTGVTAVGYLCHYLGRCGPEVKLDTAGGELTVSIRSELREIDLTGPTEYVFRGVVDIPELNRVYPAG